MRSEKQFLLDEIKEKIDGSQAFLITRYGKMNPNLASDFRGILLQAGGDFEVVKKRILLKAAAEAGCTIQPELLDGYHIGVVFAKEDPIQTTKAVFKFRQDNEEILLNLSYRRNHTHHHLVVVCFTSGR